MPNAINHRHHLPGTTNLNQHEKLARHSQLYTTEDSFVFSIVRNTFARAISQVFHGQDLSANQFDYLNIQGQRKNLGFLGFLEDLEYCWAQIRIGLGIPTETRLPHLNPRIMADYRDLYDNESGKVITEEYSRDLKELAHSFDQEHSNHSRVESGEKSLND